MDTPTTALKPDLARHSAITRLLHWSLAVLFVALLLSGFAMYAPGLFGWLYGLFGGHKSTKALHPWFGVAMTVLFVFLFLNWVRAMRWTAADSAFVRGFRRIALGASVPPPAGTGFFNGGQKLYFWSVAWSVVLFLATGLVIWFKEDMPKRLYAACHAVHGYLAILMAAGLLVHIYKATIGEPGALRSMIRGTVTEEWARTRRPAWHRESAGQD
jgi:formate dehydrogenase subunit gamma